MDKQTFHTFHANCRISRNSNVLMHNGLKWSVSRDGCQRLDSSGCFDRVGGIALALNHAGDARHRMKLKGATRGLLSMIRETRMTQ